MSRYRRIAELEAAGAEAAVVTVVRVSGSTPRSPGARMIVHATGRIEGTVGGGRVEHEAIELARAAIRARKPSFVELQLTQSLGMCCGGTMSLYVEPLLVSPRLLIFGAGHVGSALCRAASAAGFEVHVADERAQQLEDAKAAGAFATYEELDDPALPIDAGSFVMIATHDHALDQRLLESILPRPHRWLGVIGSRRKAELTRQRLAHKGFAEERIAAVRIPVGVAIGAETPEEIAVSILAELIAVRREAAAGLRLEEKRP